MNILISSAGRRVSLLKSFKNELVRIFPEGKVFASDSKPILSPACQVADASFEVPRLSDIRFIPTLLKICQQHHIKLVIPTIDTELQLLADHVREFRKAGIELLVCSADFVSICRNKRSIHDFFKSNEIPVAREFLKHDFEIPMFIKPLDGSGSSDTRAIFSKEQLMDQYVLDDNLMFLEYFDQKDFDEFTCDLYYDKKGVLRCSVARQRLEVREGEVSKSLTVWNELQEFLKEKLRKIEGVRGCLTLQVFKHKRKNKIIGIEINPRFGGGYPLAYIAGANYPKWIIEEYLQGKSIKDRFDCWEPNTLMLRYDNEIIINGYYN